MHFTIPGPLPCSRELLCQLCSWYEISKSTCVCTHVPSLGRHVTTELPVDILAAHPCRPGCGRLDTWHICHHIVLRGPDVQFVSLQEPRRCQMSFASRSLRSINRPRWAHAQKPSLGGGTWWRVQNGRAGISSGTCPLWRLCGFTSSSLRRSRCFF